MDIGSLDKNESKVLLWLICAIWIAKKSHGSYWLLDMDIVFHKCMLNKVWNRITGKGGALQGWWVNHNYGKVLVCTWDDIWLLKWHNDHTKTTNKGTTNSHVWINCVFQDCGRYFLEKGKKVSWLNEDRGHLMDLGKTPHGVEENKLQHW